MNDDENIDNAPKKASRDVIIETGAAAVSALAFGLVGAVIGNKVGALGDSKRHQLHSAIGGWVGGAVAATLSLYASFKTKLERDEKIRGLEDDNKMLREKLAQETLTAKTFTSLTNGPKQAETLSPQAASFGLTGYPSPAPAAMVKHPEHQQMLQAEGLKQDR